MRGLAARVREIAEHPAQAARRALWYAHNALEPTRPPVLCFPERAWTELVPDACIQSRRPLLRTYEWDLRHRIYRWEHLHDDFVIEPVIRVPLVFHRTGYGVETRRVYTEEERPAAPDTEYAYNSDLMAIIGIMGEYRGPFGQECRTAWRMDPPLKEVVDPESLQHPTLTLDRQASDRNLAFLQEAVGDILEVRPVGLHWINCSLIGSLNALRGMEQVMLDIYERPKWLHAIMDFLTRCVETQLDEAESKGWLAPNTGSEHVGSSLCFTRELASDTPIRAADQWGHATVQSAPNWSPAMQDEFVISYQRRLLDRFGLNAYGCCEPLRANHLDAVMAVKRLRRLIVSPWSDVDAVAGALGERVIFAWKPHPSGISSTFDPESSERELRDVLRRTTGCRMEIIMKDLGGVDGEPSRVDRYTRMMSRVAGADAATRNPDACEAGQQ